MKKGQGVQVIYGPHVTVIKAKLEEYLETAPKNSRMRHRIMYRYRKMLQQEMQMDRTVQRLRTKMQVQHSPWHL